MYRKEHYEDQHYRDLCILGSNRHPSHHLHSKNINKLLEKPMLTTLCIFRSTMLCCIKCMGKVVYKFKASSLVYIQLKN